MFKKTLCAGIAAALLILAGVSLVIARRQTSMPDCTGSSSPASISPDYTDIVIPPNIAPLNFQVRGDYGEYAVRISSTSGKPINIRSSKPGIRIPLSPWKRLLDANRGDLLRTEIYAKRAAGDWCRFTTITNRVAMETIDSYLVYRMIPPIHHSWNRVEIHQRCLEDFHERPIVDNRTFSRGCVNCHTFRQGDPETMSFQVRSKDFGLPMMIVKDGDVRQVDTRAGQGVSPAAYHSWHPNGRIIVFSRNRPSPFEHTAADVRDVWDADSDLAIYFVDENRVETPPAISTPEARENWPSWSADGKYLYFCSAPQIPIEKFRDVRYSLMRVSYDEVSNSWGKPEVLVSGEKVGRSLAQPRESPDGKWLLFSMCEYGNFPIYQRSSDIYVMDTSTGKWRDPGINSDMCDSWRCWSTNGRWIVFSSKRGNGLVAKPHFSYVDEDGRFYKPFILPQKDPAFYESFTWTYNVPELITGPVKQSRAEFGMAICEPDEVITADGGRADEGKETSSGPKWQYHSPQ